MVEQQYVHGYLFAQAMTALSVEDPMELIEAGVEVTSQLEEATRERTVSLLPTDLQTTNSLLNQLVGILENNVEMIAGDEGLQADEVRI